QCPGGTVNRRILLSLLTVLALATLAACSSGDSDAASARDGRADETPVETSAEAGGDRSGDDADNPVVFGDEVGGPAGTTAVVVAPLVAQGRAQPPFTATWSITDRPRWALYTNWIESGEIEVEVTEGGPAVVRVIRARYVDPDDPFAGIDEIEEVDTFEVGSSSAGSIEFP